MITIITWSHVDCAFVNMIKRQEQSCCVLRYKHHKSWNTERRQYIAEFLNFMKFLGNVALLSRKTQIVLFGHYLCRICFFLPGNKNTFYIFNELPNTKTTNLLGQIDRWIFKRRRNIFVSSKARLKLLSRYGFCSEHVKILENITFDNFSDGEQCIPVSQERAKIVYSGTVSKRRFNNTALKLIEAYHLCDNKIDIYSHYVENGLSLNKNYFDFKGSVSHCRMFEISQNYNVGLLTYAIDNDNDLYAAPLKLYEYVNANMKVLIIGKNPGLETVRKNYPNLFVDIARLDEPIVFDSNYMSERSELLRNALGSNIDLVKQLMEGYAHE